MPLRTSFERLLLLVAPKILAQFNPLEQLSLPNPHYTPIFLICSIVRRSTSTDSKTCDLAGVFLAGASEKHTKKKSSD